MKDYSKDNKNDFVFRRNVFSRTKICVFFAFFASVLMIATPCLARPLNENVTEGRVRLDEKPNFLDVNIKEKISFLFEKIEKNNLLNIDEILDQLKVMNSLFGDEDGEPCCIIMIQLLILLFVYFFKAIGQVLWWLAEGMAGLIAVYIAIVQSLADLIRELIFGVVNLLA